MGKIIKSRETVVFLITIGVIFLLSYVNILASFRRERDYRRREDLISMVNALNTFHNHYKFYPPSSENGEVIACLGESSRIDRYNLIYENPVACRWGVDGFSLDPDDPETTPIMASLPQDPKTNEGYKYRYVSNGQEYQIYASYEGSNEPDIIPELLGSQINCGVAYCNTGKASPQTALEKPLK